MLELYNLITKEDETKEEKEEYLKYLLIINKDKKRIKDALVFLSKGDRND